MSNLNLHTAGLKELRRTPPNALIPYLSRWYSNNSPTDLGVARFVFDLYELNRRAGYTPLYKDFVSAYGVAPWAAEALSEYYTWEEGMSKEDRCFVYATYREGTKTSWFTFWSRAYEALIGQYGIYHKDFLTPETDYQVLVGKNLKEAAKRLMSISSLLNKPLVHHLFGDLKPSFQEVKKKDAKDSAELLILSNGYTFQANGVNQPIRGSNVLQARPKVIIFDDVQNKENTKTEESRKDCDKEVMEESFGAVVDLGTIVYIGNKIHQDDTLGKLLDPENTQWKKKFFTLTVKEINGVRYPGVGDMETEVPEWGQRWTMEKLKKRREWFIRQPKMGGLRGFLKEYYNIIRTEADYQLKYHTARYHREFGLNWLVFRDAAGNEEYINCKIIIGDDPAISEKEGSSDSAIAAVAFLPDHRRYVLDISSGKYDIHDRYFDGHYVPDNGVVALQLHEMNKIKRKGNVGEIIRMFMKYNADGIVVETAATNSTFFNELVSALDKLHLHPPKMPYPARGAGDKTTRNKECPLAYFEAGLYHLPGEWDEVNKKWICKIPKLEAEIQSFPSRQDHIDSLHIAEQMASFPARVIYNRIGINLKQPEHRILEPALKEQQGTLLNEVEPWIFY